MSALNNFEHSRHPDSSAPNERAYELQLEFRIVVPAIGINAFVKREADASRSLLNRSRLAMNRLGHINEVRFAEKRCGSVRLMGSLISPRARRESWFALPAAFVMMSA